METAHTSLIHSLFFSTGGETNVYAIVAPFVVGLILLEIMAAAYLRKRTGKRLISFQEAVMNFAHSCVTKAPMCSWRWAGGGLWLVVGELPRV